MNSDDLNSRLERLSPVKRALFEKRRFESRLKSSSTPSISRRTDREIAPLSFAQQRLWFLNELEPESPTYRTPKVLRLSGALNVEVLERSLNQVIARHESLRTNIVLIDNMPVQRIADQRSVELPFVDLTEIIDHDREAEAQRLITETIRRPFDFSKDFGLRAMLLKLASLEHILVVVKHYICVDGWSSEIFWREFETFFKAFNSGQTVALPELPIQYADFAVWQREWLQGSILDKQQAYWQKQLSNLSPIQLPTDRVRPDSLNPLAAVRVFLLSSEVSAALKILSREEGATLFMTLLAAFQTLLFRYTGEKDIAIGTLIAGRNRAEIKDLVGTFANTLVLRTDFIDDPTVRELMRRVKRVCLDAYSHQDLPFEKLVEELQPERSLSHNPLSQIIFQLNNRRKPLTLPGLLVEEIELSVGMSKFDLTLSMFDGGSTLSGRLTYNTDLFDPSTIERMLGHFQVLLEGIVANRDLRVSELPLLNHTEKQQLLLKWNDSAREYPNDKRIHQLVEEQVEKTPDARALVYENQELTYRELNRRANQLAHYLKKLGVGPETLVAICIEPSTEMVISILGVLKAGGAYLPLDPGYPEELLAFMVEDSQPKLLLAQARFRDKLPAEYGDVLCVDAHWNVIARESGDNPSVEAAASDLAYVIYTSGSTGKRKGVMISHRAVVNHMSWMQHVFGFNEADGIVQKTPISFDASVWEVFAPLIAGSRLIVARPDGYRDSAYLCRVIQELKATVLQLVPSMLRVMLQEKDFASCTTLRLVFCGGEALAADLVQQFHLTFGCRASLWNLYGPTETSIDATYWECKGAGEKATVPIGRPISNTEIYILDEHLNPVPTGMVGEIYIGGPGLARGYLNRPELTAQHFIHHSFDGEAARRLYRSGDLARYLADGNIEFVGRIDSQVKIRGWRIELGEIEAVLVQHPAIQQAVVIAREDTPGDRQLAAYIVASSGSTVSAHNLRTFLQLKLPESMIPSAFLFLESMPLTSNGKLDRKALPTFDQTRPELENAFVAPRTPLEEILAEIWAEVLKLEQVGIYDNFFHLGGHSLLATQVVSRVNQSIQINLPLRALFESPTIAGLADSIHAHRSSESDLRRPQPIVAVPRNKDIPLSFAQERLWFLDRLYPDSATYNVSAAFRLSGDLKTSALEQSLNEVVSRHEVLRTVFATVNGNPVQKILPALAVSLTPTELIDVSENDRELVLQSLLKRETLQPFDLGSGPLIRARLWRLAAHDHVLALNLHHSVCDGWSMNVLFRELSFFYREYCGGKPASLAELPVQYADYSVWQRDWLQGENLDKQLSYWVKQLDGISPLQLCTDRPRPAVQTYQASSQALQLSMQLSRAIKALSQREGVTLFMTLLAAFQTLLFKYCGQFDIAVGTPIAGRTRHEIEGLIGFFVNTLVLRSDFSKDPTFKELLRQVRETTLAAYTHQDVPFEKLVEQLHPVRNANISPLFQVMLVLQNDGYCPLTLEGLDTNQIHTSSVVGKFDLLMAISHKQGNLRVSLRYNTDLFDAATIERMLGHFQVLLEGIVDNPDLAISELPLLTKREKHQILIEWNDTGSEYPKQKCIHQLFEEQVERTPDAVAIVFDNQQLTYRELNNRANQLAHYLRRLGAGSEVLVGLCLERSSEMIIGILGALKAGGAYVPLDPEHPTERLAFILEDTQAGVLLTQEKLLVRLPEPRGCDRAIPATENTKSKILNRTVVCLDRDWAEISREPSENVASGATANDLAYVMYTSGSRGTPKGVEVVHRAIARLLFGVDYAQLDESQTFLHLAPTSFDASTWEIWGALLHGAKCVVYTGATPGPKELADLLRKHAVSTLWLTASLFNVVINELPEALSGVGQLLVGGEALSVPHVRRALSMLPRTRIINGYGPTENTTFTCCYSIPRCLDENGSSIPIGRPIGNTQVYILDRHLNPVPVGISGEICIGGDGLARGYLHDSQLTVEKFIRNPFSDDPQSRLYRTGDRARFLPDGNIEFLGRSDDQVKIRGYRIELREIETALSADPRVSETVVLAHEPFPGDKRLVAYVVPKEGAAPTIGELQGLLKKKLPEYMVPSTFVFLEALPLMSNGKVDRKALPAPDQGKRELEQSFVAPRTPVEKIIAELWGEVLQLEHVGIHDNFFEVGGHSLNAVQLIARVCQSFEIELPLRRLFETPTIGGLAETVGTLCWAKQNAALGDEGRIREEETGEV